jgi:hypothetical protein
VSSGVRWPRVAVEVVAVVASILLAFWIDAGWEARQERLGEQDALGALHVEMQRNLEAVQERVESNEWAQDRAADFLRMTPAEVRAGLPEDGGATHVILWAPFTFDPEIGAAVAFLERGVPRSARAREVRQALTDWNRMIADAREESAVLWDASRAVLSLMTTHIADIVPGDEDGVGLDLISSDESEYAPRMARIRADERVIAAAIAKFNLQGIYTNELYDMLEQAGLILELLEGTQN